MLGVVTGEMGRRADFYDYYDRLTKPPNTFVLKLHGPSPAFNRNVIINAAIEQECTHVMLLDDDMAFQQDLLVKLLAHNKDIVTGLYYSRNYPHQPMMFEKIDMKGRVFAYFLNKDTPDLLKIRACGFGCCLIKTEVLKKMEKPWVRLGEIDPQEWCDDTGFFFRIFKDKITDDIWCDTTIKVGHMATMILWPERDKDGTFHTLYDTKGMMNGTGQCKLPQLSPESMEVGG